MLGLRLPLTDERYVSRETQGTQRPTRNGEPIYTRLDTFYTVVLRLFGSGSLGGVRVVARVG